MAFVTADRVKETTSTSGTGTYTLAGAVTGFQSFAVIGNANTCYYAITDGTDWEVGLGTYTSAGTTLARTTILASSNAGSAVNWAAVSKQIWVDFPALNAGFLGGGTTGFAANNVLLGNGTGRFQVVAPSTSGNVLTSDGTTWGSAAPATFTAASQAQMEAASSNTVGVTPANAQWHPSASKCWADASADGNTLNASYNITSITDNGTGDLTITIGTDFSSANYGALVFAGANAVPINNGTQRYIGVSSKLAGSIRILSWNGSNTAADPLTTYNFAGFGDQ